MRKHLLWLLFCAAFALAAVVPALAGNPWTGTCTIDNPADNTTSSALALPKNVSKIAIQVPTLTSSTLHLHVSVDGTTYQDLYCIDNTTGVSQQWSTAAGTGATNHEVPCDMSLWKYLKVVAGTAQAADRTFTIYGIAPIRDTRVP